MDKYKLQYIMKKNGISVEDMAKKMGISKSALYSKMNGRSQFTLAEIQMIIKILDLDSPVDIFFAKEVS